MAANGTTSAGEAKAEDAEVAWTNSIRHETSSLEVVEARDGLRQRRSSNPSLATFKNGSRSQQVPLDLLIVMVPSVRYESS